MMVVFSVERWRGRHSVMAASLSACGMAAGKLCTRPPRRAIFVFGRQSI